jgi:uncharacterized protein YcbK (DUF882 family)
MLAGIIAVTTLLPMATVPAQANNERSLYIHYTHTKETARIVYKRNGRFVQEGLDRLNVFLRDWRRNEPAKMDPALFNLLWEVYQESGATQPIHVVSAYRSPATNNMLRASSSGVAENSQHMRGQAIDFYIPGVPVNRLREIGFRKQVGGVGYYPSSGNPFVHLDTGSVRAWPRMTQAQLQQIFPDGRTLHLPSNGNVLSQAGRQYAQAEWERCRRVPCSAGNSMSRGSTQVADGSSGGRRSLMDVFFGGNDSGQSQPAPQTQTAAAPRPAAPVAAPAPTPAAAPAAQQPATQVAAAPAQPAQPVPAAAPPSPPARPDTMVAAAPAPEQIPFAIVDADDMATQIAAIDAVPEIIAPIPPQKSTQIAALTSGANRAAPISAENDGTRAIAALDDPVPLRRPDFDDATIMSAYAAGSNQPVIQAASLTAPVPAFRPASVQSASAQPTLTDQLQAASFSPQMGLEGFADLFSGPIGPMNGGADEAMANAMSTLASSGELIAPDLAHVTDVFLSANPISSAQFAFGDPTTPGADDGEGYQLAFNRSGAGTSAGTGDTIWVRMQ